MKQALEKSVAELTRAIDRFPWEDKRAYADWLAQTYYYVRHSTRLLAAAAARFSYDPRGNTLHHRFAAHMAEENKHELLCIHDLKVLDTSIEAHPEHPSTRMFYEPQYFKIEHEDPIVLFGYILPLEAIAPLQGKRVVERVMATFGPKCASFLKLHAEEDVEHLEKALAMLAEVDEDNKRLIVENLEQTSFAYVTLLQDVRRRLDAPQR